MPAVPAVRRQLRALRHPAFRNLWLARTTSTIGDRLVLVALALFVSDIGSATDVGLVLGVQTLLLVAFLLIGGVLADRLPRAKVMIATDLARAALHLLLAGLILGGVVTIWEIVVIEALFGIAEAFFQPAYSGLLPRTVPDAEIQDAQALTNLTENLAELTGPALATALVLGLGAGWAFLFDAATFLAGFVFMLRVHVADEPTVAADRTSPLVELADGFGEFRSRPWIWVTVVAFALAVPLGYAPLFVLGPSVADSGYGTAAVFGIVTTLFGVGALVGALTGLRWRPLHPMRTGFLLLAGWPLLLVAFGAGAPVAVVLVLAIAMGMGFALFDVLWRTALAERVPPKALSRVSAYDWVGSLVFLPLGFLLAGPIADATSAGGVMVVGGALTAATLALGLIPRDTRLLRRIERPPE